jgi:hypothetical protein
MQEKLILRSKKLVVVAKQYTLSPQFQQFCSSLPSKQSSNPSQRSADGMQRLLSHRNPSQAATLQKHTLGIYLDENKIVSIIAHKSFQLQVR